MRRFETIHRTLITTARRMLDPWPLTRQVGDRLFDLTVDARALADVADDRSLSDAWRGVMLAADAFVPDPLALEDALVAVDNVLSGIDS